MAGTFDLRGSTLAPAGMIWSVVILSPTFIRTFPANISGIASLVGSAFMLGPLIISTFSGSWHGAIIIVSSTWNFSGIATLAALRPGTAGVRIPPAGALLRHAS